MRTIIFYILFIIWYILKFLLTTVFLFYHGFVNFQTGGNPFFLIIF